MDFNLSSHISKLLGSKSRDDRAHATQLIHENYQDLILRYIKELEPGPDCDRGGIYSNVMLSILQNANKGKYRDKDRLLPFLHKVTESRVRDFQRARRRRLGVLKSLEELELPDEGLDPVVSPEILESVHSSITALHEPRRTIILAYGEVFEAGRSMDRNLEEAKERLRSRLGEIHVDSLRLHVRAAKRFIRAGLILRGLIRTSRGQGR